MHGLARLITLLTPEYTRGRKRQEKISHTYAWNSIANEVYNSYKLYHNAANPIEPLLRRSTSVHLINSPI